MRPDPRLVDLLPDREFIGRHIGADDADRAEMLKLLGVPSLEALVDQVVPPAIRTHGELDPAVLGAPRSEPEVLAALAALMGRNERYTSLIGMGYSGTITPPVIQRNVLENPAWYTAYTPYQPEISQGRLEALLAFQTMVADLSGLELANASLLDEATAAAEAMTMARRVGSHKADAFFVDADCHPQTIAVIETRARALGIELVVGDPAHDLDPTQVYGVLIQEPGSLGAVHDRSAIVDAVHTAGGVVVAACDLLSLVLLEPPGRWGVDIVVGSAQRFGVPMGFGGPHAAFLATHEGFARSLPGRLVGASTDAAGRRALRLALQTREQHIRREKATSNICTAQVLLAVIAGFYATWHGPEGLTRIAERVHRLTSILAAGLREGGYELAADTWFDTITVRAPGRAEALAAAARQRRINLRLVDGDRVGISLDETTSADTVAAVWEAFGVTASVADLTRLDEQAPSGIPTERRRSVPALPHDVFNRHHSEHDMLRYLRRLADLDLALDRTMIPLGSCTMKLNATSEMLPITWPEVAELHPFAPQEQTAGYRQLIDELEAALVEVTGYDAVSFQPNAGSQGELAGLLAISRYHQSRSEPQRTVCLIPASAHGTNAASAVMAGMQVTVVACDERGNVSLPDLRAKVDAAGDRLAACMVTYPSTHGVFEEAITELCEIVHGGGGQVYLDGANLNALVGIAKPGRFGADVSHLNLHKTFCIPHGGGGPGVGPVAARAHLAPFLPNHPLRADAGPATGVGAVSAAPFGSASILPITWVYLRLMGAEGLRAATANAVLNANYVSARLADAYPTLYVGANGRVAHECILDLRPLTKTTGVSVDDVAKRLMDYGFHAPTMSFPVPGTLMVEPTESETKAELDRFCDAMLAIRAEIDRDPTILANAPHTAEDVCATEWNRTYSRDEAAFPVEALRHSKYWPPVGRIDAAYGDRHLVCACPPIDAYA